MKLKTSFYNELVPIAETKEFLLYNILSGGLNVINQDLGDFLTEKNEKEFLLEEYSGNSKEIRELFEEGFLVDADVDERKLYQSNYIANQNKKFRTNSHIGITIGTTILCNMGCPYCFESFKPNKSLRDEKVIDGIVDFAENMIMSAPVKKWSMLSITWYGGEPLINKAAISSLSKRFIQLSEKHSIPFSASIITNGILLDKEAWKLLNDNRIQNVQVTIDGSKEVHNTYRPLKNSKAPNYEQILENLTLMPMEIHTNIRVNTDKRVAATLPQLLDDLKLYGIWPQRHESFSISLARLRFYPASGNSEIDYLTDNEYFEVQQQFSQLKVIKFNEWGKQNKQPVARLKWKLPDKQSDCATYVSPYFFVFDPEGMIHKCWETIHDTKNSSGSSVFKHWSTEDFEKYLSYSRTNIHTVCYNCKFNPVCEGLSCAYDSLAQVKEGKFPCTPWKTLLPDYFKKMYLLSMERPGEVSFDISKSAELQTHSNK